MKKLVFIFASILLVVSFVLVGCSGGGSTSGEEQKGESSLLQEDVTFIIPNAPGGSNDLSVRGIIRGMEQELGVEVIPKNQPASKGIVAAVELTQSENNGQTLYFNSQSLILLALQEDNLDLSKIQPLAQVVEDTSAITVAVDSPYNSLQDLVDAAKENPGKIKIATNGVGALWDFSAKTFANTANINLQYIPYTSGGNAMSTAVASGEVDVSANSPSEVKPLVDAGKLKVLAVQSNERHGLFPNVPTAKEQGFDSEFPVWRGVFTVKGTDEAILQQLEDSIRKSYESEDFKGFLENNGMPGKFRGHKEFTEFFEEQVEMYEEIVKNQ
ncbi:MULTISPECIES: tripartite tricarboxylate transporter substrate binding protein [Metabacillus]|uniref:Tripartite tricarboxylate transporter substrate binding protein n=2 Tax=Metabacillus TaxID=2675233 RepID=A0A179T4E4_9BACI|nr:MULTISPECIES: tripartite tricarboxylate transporter substrate binding protein [Metabacillus]OAS89046.1 hypothetical protein A6K24_00300 [Metabacillus litoralis]QNF28566.1 tripartite tricarboxylate transporter substrate binding protein [Metabacillus sp. KUDC1714]